MTQHMLVKWKFLEMVDKMNARFFYKQHFLSNAKLNMEKKSSKF